jgi:hypothetical protein
MNQLHLTLLAAFVLTVPATAQQATRRADITGNAVDGKCTIEVVVDGAAEVEVQGNVGRLRNLGGQQPTWSRFVCNGRMPANPQDFRFRGIDGRGSVQLLQDPRQNGGRIVFRIDDPQGGREGYTVDLEWRGSNEGQWSSQDGRRWLGPDSRGNDGGQGQRDPADRWGAGGPRDDRGADANRDRRFYDEGGRWNAEGAAQAIRMCQAEVASRIRRDGFRDVTFQSVVPDNNPGRNDFVNGLATARRGRSRSADYQFSCSVDLGSGRVRSAQVTRR